MASTPGIKVDPESNNLRADLEGYATIILFKERAMMFEGYIHQVEKQLSRMPLEERNREIAELRQHLEAAVAARLEMGEREDEAIWNALHQFGSAGHVASQLTQAHRRQSLRRWMDRWIDHPLTMTAIVTGLIAVEMPIICMFPDLLMRLGVHLPENASDPQMILYLAAEPSVWLYGIVVGATLYRVAPHSSLRSLLPGYLLCMFGVVIWLERAWPVHSVTGDLLGILRNACIVCIPVAAMMFTILALQTIRKPHLSR